MREKIRIDIARTSDAFLLAMKGKGYTQEGLASEAKLHQSRISRIVTKKFARLSAKQLRAFDILGIKPVYLPQDGGRAEIHRRLDECLSFEPHLEEGLMRLLNAGIALRNA